LVVLVIVDVGVSWYGGVVWFSCAVEVGYEFGGRSCVVG